MAFYLSPGVNVVEKDLTSIIPAVSTSIGAFAGPFVWGPVMDPTTISSENELVARFGKPTSPSASKSNAASWFTAANFLAYTNNLLTVRVDCTNARNAVAIQSRTVTGVTIVSGGTGYVAPTVQFSSPDIEGGTTTTGTATVVGGVITAITIDEPGSGYSQAPSITIIDDAGTGFNGTVSTVSGGIKVNNDNDYEQNYINGSGVVGPWVARYPGALGNSIRVEMADSATFGTVNVNAGSFVPGYTYTIKTIGDTDFTDIGASENTVGLTFVATGEGTGTGVATHTWNWSAEFDSVPGTSIYASASNSTNDELHIVIIDSDGAWTGTRGAILEKFAYVSKASDARKSDGTNNYYKNVINTNSKYIRWMDHPTNVGAGDAWGTEAKDAEYASLTSVSSFALSGGIDDVEASEGALKNGFSLFANSEVYDLSLIPTGAVPAGVAKFIIENVAEIRKDCVAFVSPATSSGGVIQGIDAVENTIKFRTDTSFNVNSSYGVLDSGWKYQYDRYYDVYRWVPLNGDVAGLCARTDYTNDAWWSPGGLNRGQIKNVVKLNINPNKTERDNLYKSGVNPVVSFPGEGTVLFGDKTLLAKPSAFDRINVRRLFIVLEKAIATAAKYQLFEFNDSFTRAQFRSMTEPFLRDVQGRRGVTDFRVVCDERNNTGEVIDRNEFVADIYIKPTRSINFITLNFIAARTGIAFEEIGA